MKFYQMKTRKKSMTCMDSMGPKQAEGFTLTILISMRQTICLGASFKDHILMILKTRRSSGHFLEKAKRREASVLAE